ncbi:MAG: hypothetical protein WD278_13490 [Pirellulales bacterium]
MHEIAKLLLEHARTEEERSNAIEKAMYLGMPLHEIEAYLDWLDMMAERMKPEKPPD